jgi:hypothetical protein
MTEEKDPSSSSAPKQQERSSETSCAPKKVKWIPLQRVPAEGELLAEEMEEIYDEDKVTHRHGSSEPEGD